MAPDSSDGPGVTVMPSVFRGLCRLQNTFVSVIFLDPHTNLWGRCPSSCLLILILAFSSRAALGMATALWGLSSYSLILAGALSTQIQHSSPVTPPPTPQAGWVPPWSFYPYDTSTMSFPLFSSTAVNTHLMKEFVLDKDTQLRIEWAGVCERALEVSTHCWLNACEFLLSALGITGLGKTLLFCHQIS